MKARPIILRNETVRQRVLAVLASLDLTKPWAVTIEPYRRKRTLSQNAYLHAILGVIADETGNSLDDVKEAYRDMFLGKVAVKLGNEERLVGRSTTTLETVEMNDLIEKIRAHAAAELGIKTPSPDDQYWEAA